MQTRRSPNPKVSKISESSSKKPKRLVKEKNTKNLDKVDSVKISSVETVDSKRKASKTEEVVQKKPRNRSTKVEIMDFPKISGPFDDLAKYITDPGWQKILQESLSSDEFSRITSFLNSEVASGKEIYPSKEDIFTCFNLTPFNQVKVVVIGQDPYHDGSAHGLAFSVVQGKEKLPSSLRTIYKELSEDPEIEFSTPGHGCLTEWAKRGILLLNTVLTVEAHKANSHSRCGWAWFTDQILHLLNEHHDKLIFILWGNFAQKKKSQLGENHIILEGAHPSGLTCGKFYGCRHFSAVNTALKKDNKEPIDWRLT